MAGTTSKTASIPNGWLINTFCMEYPYSLGGPVSKLPWKFNISPPNNQEDGNVFEMNEKKSTINQ
jgi:hypothetical protein